MGLVAGVLALNAIFVALGYCTLAAALVGRPLRAWASYAGLALLAGAAVGGLGTFLAAIAGARAGPATFLLVSAWLAAAGLVAARSSRARRLVGAPEAPAAPPAGELARLVALAAGFALVAIAALGLVGGFRSSPWLDDVWGIWLPKGVALAELGLDPRMFAADPRFVAFEVPDYPLWWSTVLALDMRFVGRIDLRAVDAQTALLVVGFVGAVARLLWGRVRPWLLAVGLLPLVAAPELWRHAQGGLADLVLALFLALFALALALWAFELRGFWILVAAVAGAAAASIKSEGLPELLVLAAVAAAFAGRRALGGIALATGLALLTAVPWWLWRAAHDVPASTSVRDALDPGYLGDRTERAGPAAQELLAQLLHPHWLFVVPLLAILSVAAAVRLRDARPLAPLAAVAALYAFWVWAYWAETENLDYLLTTSAYRVVDTAVLVAAVSVPVLAEVHARVGRAGASPGRGSRGFWRRPRM
jgi:hypothetical protein